ncbi:MAG: LysM peptidoglycan-binding domain-containing protein [Lachnospiraceae bacterium]|nr:LysM peptidoglycan-binding domain-containing protein [Candidatus Merdinaster equi]
MKKIAASVCTFLLAFTVLLPIKGNAMGNGSEVETQIQAVFEGEPVQEAFHYKHDPRLNKKAMEDIKVDPSAVYGFSPREDSDRLGSFASEDWSDPVKVAQWRKEREEYHEQFNEMYALWVVMEQNGSDVEEIARAVSNLRNVIRLNSYKDNPEGLVKVKESNLKKYGNEFGPTADSLYEKYGSWEMVLQKSFSANAGMDACLGLYDEMYDKNVKSESVDEIRAIYYTVKVGDNLSKLAEKYLNDRTLWRVIYDANSEFIIKPNLIYAGQEFFIPFEEGVDRIA